MAEERPCPPWLRPDAPDEEIGVSFAELFFDLVFVFAITQLAHALLADLTLPGAGRALLLLMALWWVWVLTTWATNRLNPDSQPVRLMLLAQMLAGLMVAVALPHAFDRHAMMFAAAYVAMQLGRVVFLAWAVRGHDRVAHADALRNAAWLGASACLWLAGGWMEGLRPALWAAAVGLEYLAPAVGFRVPGLGRSRTREWNVDAPHMAERCGLFLIIALGEGLLVTGRTFAAAEWTGAAMTAFLVAFLGSVLMWWIYFDTGVERGRARLERDRDPGRLARAAYTYVHLPIVAGLVVTAVADERVLARPTGTTDLATALVVLGGPVLFVGGNLLFKKAISGVYPLSHRLGLLLLALSAPLAPSVQPVMLAAVAVGVLLVVAVWETVSLRVVRAATTG
jgi:low temperature requirement protein LtrA